MISRRWGPRHCETFPCACQKNDSTWREHRRTCRLNSGVQRRIRREHWRDNLRQLSCRARCILLTCSSIVAARFRNYAIRTGFTLKSNICSGGGEIPLQRLSKERRIGPHIGSTLQLQKQQHAVHLRIKLNPHWRGFTKSEKQWMPGARACWEVTAALAANDWCRLNIHSSWRL